MGPVSAADEFEIDPALVNRTPCPQCGTVPAQILWRTGKPTKYIHSDGTVHKDLLARLTVEHFRGGKT